MGSNTLKIGWKPPPPPAPPVADVAPAASNDAPQRKHTKPAKARADGKWYAVIGMKREEAYHRPIFRHPTRETADDEADYLSKMNPGQLFVVVESVSWHLAQRAQERKAA